MTTDKGLVERLEHAHANSVQRCLGSDIFGQAAARIRELEAEVDRLTDENEELRHAPWPQWATKVLAVIREYSGYDGYDDASDGVDLPAELDEVLSELERRSRKATEARCRKLEEALRKVVPAAADMHETLHGMAEEHSGGVPDWVNRHGEAVAAARALLDQADGEKSDG